MRCVVLCSCVFSLTPKRNAMPHTVPDWNQTFQKHLPVTNIFNTHTNHIHDRVAITRWTSSRSFAVNNSGSAFSTANASRAGTSDAR